MPQLGESVTEGTIGRWLVQPGQPVEKYQALAEVITDKVTAEIPAPAAGTIGSLVVPEGETVKVGTVIATMNAQGEAAVAVTSPATAAPAPPAPTAAAAPAPPAGYLPDAPAEEEPVRPQGRFSPAVMRLAQEHNVDLSRLSGTGLGGRITRKDVEAYIASGAPQQPAAPAPSPAPVPAAAAAAFAPVPAPAAPTTVAAATGDQLIPIDAVRRRIAEKMVQSKHEAPHAWTTMPVDVTALVKARAALAEEFKRREGISLSYMPFFFKAVVESLKEYPLLNSQWSGENIVVKREINLSMAVATDTALAVPVIHNADRLSLAGLNHAVYDLAAKARTNKLSLDDVTGGTFTVNNTGTFGSVLSAPIINHPQAAIISFEAIVKQPVVLENDAIAIRSMMNICLSIDHRILDGLISARFLQAVKKRIEAFTLETIHLY